MKLVIACIKPERQNAVRQELYKRSIFKMPVASSGRAVSFSSSEAKPFRSLFTD